MCELFSAIVLKNGEVIPCEYVDNQKRFSHTEQLIKLGIKDDTQDPKKMKFARIEINPPDDDIFNTDFKKWQFRIDQSITPKWWTKEDEKNCYKSLIANIGDFVWVNKKIDVLSQNVFALKDCEVNDLRGGTVNDIWGGTVNDISGGTVNDLRGGTVNDISGGTVNDIWGGTVNDISGGTVNAIRGGTVNAIRGGTVNVYNSGFIHNINKKSNGIVILRYKNPIQILHTSELDLELKNISK